MNAVPDTIVLASGNRGKLREFQKFFERMPELSAHGVELASAADFDGAAELLAGVDENGATYEDNALIKARAIADFVGLPTIADDSGIEVEALNWAPGIRSARAAEGTDADRVRWMLGAVAASGSVSRRACFVACIVTAFPKGASARIGRDFFSCEGRCWGRLTDEARGDGGFGYDPIFVPDGYDLTFGELPPEKKSEISHRAIAIKGLANIMPVVLQYYLTREI